MISKRSRRVVAHDANALDGAALEQLHQSIVAALREEYSSKHGWRFPIFDMHGELAECADVGQRELVRDIFQGGEE